MGDLLIRDVDEQTVQALKRKAEVNGTSLQQEAKKALTRGAPLTGEERRRAIESFREESGILPKLAHSTAEIIREEREDRS